MRRYLPFVLLSVAVHLLLARLPIPEEVPPEKAESRVYLSFKQTKASKPPPPPKVSPPQKQPAKPKQAKRKPRPKPRKAPAPPPKAVTSPPKVAQKPAQQESRKPASKGIPALPPMPQPQAPPLSGLPSPPPIPKLSRAPVGGIVLDLPRPLKPLPGGGYIYEYGPFTATIFPDGQVVFFDHAVQFQGFTVNGINVTEILRYYQKRLLNQFEEDPVKRAQGLRALGFINEGDDRTPIKGSGLGFALIVDVTDTIVRLHGEDPYFEHKHKLLELTRKMRLKMAKEVMSKRAMRAARNIKQRLEKLWIEPGRTIPEKHQLLFALWDECLEEGDQELVKHAQVIRNTIEVFIQKHAPRGSDEGLSAELIKAFNQKRKSKQAFVPYTDTSTVTP